MAHTDHSRRRQAWGTAAPMHADDAPRRNPRPAPRRQGTRAARIRAARLEG